MTTILAYTENNPNQPTYPGFVNISDDGEFVCVTVRSQPIVIDGQIKEGVTSSFSVPKPKFILASLTVNEEGQ